VRGSRCAPTGSGSTGCGNSVGGVAVVHSGGAAACLPVCTQVAGLRPNRVYSIALLRPHVGALWHPSGFDRALLRANVAGVETIRHPFTPQCRLLPRENASAAARCDSSAF
jgi:hypothetical protein